METECLSSVVSLFAETDAKSFEESVKKAVAQIEESPFMKRTETASAEQYFQVSVSCVCCLTFLRASVCSHTTGRALMQCCQMSFLSN